MLWEIWISRDFPCTMAIVSISQFLCCVGRILTCNSAFGGMIAFCIIVGDSIPHVFNAIFPNLKDMSFLWLLTDRRAVIVIFILGISYPLSLYRDIAKVRRTQPCASGFSAYRF
jgi:amino acid permease